MPSFFPFSNPESSMAEHARPTVESVRAQVAFMDPELTPDTGRYEAAVLLVAACSVGQNIDRLARFTGTRREQVARRARRLVDNGVWQNGHTVARWRDSLDDVESFRSDVAVAEGALCRRMDEFGQMEWAPQGYWRKHFEYSAPKGQEQPQVVCYHPHVEVPEEDPESFCIPDFIEEVPSTEAETAASRRRAPEVVPAVAAAPLWLGDHGADRGTAAGTWLPNGNEAADELFPDAVWLS